MQTTINISLPEKMYKDVKKMVSKQKYSSVSEYIRDALRGFLYKKEITENGFTSEFEDEVLKSAAEPIENDYVLETDKDIKNYFLHLKLPPNKKK